MSKDGNFMRWATIFAAVLMQAFALQPSAASQKLQGIRLRGICDYTVRPGAKAPAFESKYIFEVLVSGTSWAISYTNADLSAHQSELTTAEAAECDGTDIYCVRFQNQSAVKKAWGSRYEAIKERLPLVTAEVLPGVYPPPDHFIIQKLWFAFASGPLLNTGKGTIKPPSYVNLAVFYDPRFRCDYQTFTNETGPNIRTVVLRSNGSFLKENLVTGKIDAVACRPPFDRGYTMATGTWSNETDTLGNSTPTFDYIEFAPLLASHTTTNLLAVYSFRSSVTNRETAEMDSIPSRLPYGKVLITDRRFISAGYARLDYLATNHWLSATDTFIQAQLRNRPRSPIAEEFAAYGTGQHTAAVKYLIWALLPLPILLLLFKTLVRKNQKKQT